MLTLIEQVDRLVQTLQTSRNKLADLGLGRDELDEIDRVIAQSRSISRMDVITGGVN